MKTNAIITMAAAVAALLLTACSSTETVVVDNSGNSSCKHFVNEMGALSLKMERSGNDLICELNGFTHETGPTEMWVDADFDGGTLNCWVNKNYGEDRVGGMSCSNLYFTVRDVTQDKFKLRFQNKELCDVDMTGHTTFMYLFSSGETGYDTILREKPVLLRAAFEKSPMAQTAIAADSEEAKSIKKTLKLDFYDDVMYRIVGELNNVLIPVDATEKSLKLSMEGDDTIVLSVEHNGSETSGLELMNIEFILNNAVEDVYGIKVNPYPLVIRDREDEIHEYTLYEYEGHLFRNTGQPFEVTF